ncbi:MAG: hypothetical protein LBG23_01950 [Endomicrobium sp.]|nr:hypothetical protein [Endomicrobium sp.]
MYERVPIKLISQAQEVSGVDYLDGTDSMYAIYGYPPPPPKKKVRNIIDTDFKDFDILQRPRRAFPDSRCSK